MEEREREREEGRAERRRRRREAERVEEGVGLPVYTREKGVGEEVLESGETRGEELPIVEWGDEGEPLGSGTTMEGSTTGVILPREGAPGTTGAPTV